jgi:hypothetical protein
MMSLDVSSTSEIQEYIITLIALTLPPIENKWTLGIRQLQDGRIDISKRTGD